MSRCSYAVTGRNQGSETEAEPLLGHEKGVYVALYDSTGHPLDGLFSLQVEC